MMTVFILVLVMTCLSSLLFMVAKATCLGDTFHEVAGKKNQHQTLGILVGSKSCYNAGQVQFFASRDKC